MAALFRFRILTLHLPQLRSLDDNRLTGPLPNWIGEEDWWLLIQDFPVEASFQRNDFCGPVPPGFCDPDRNYFFSTYVSKMYEFSLHNHVSYH